MGIFSEAPESFKIDRKSKFAVNLKSLILNRLLRFCPDCADDVLAEYITVLVCNGKNQNQAKEDLEAFLGEKSREFVSWLWHLLMKYEYQLITELSSKQRDNVFSSLSDTDSENDNGYGEPRDFQKLRNKNSDNLMGEGGEIYCSSTKVSKSFDMRTSKDHHRSSSNEMTRNVQSSGPSRTGANDDFLTKVPPHLGKYRSRSVYINDEPSSLLQMHPVSLSGRHPDSLLRADPASITQLSHGVNPDHPYTLTFQENRLSSLPQSPSFHNNKPRRSVWDRLGNSLNDETHGSQISDCFTFNKSENTEEWNFHPSTSIPISTEQIGPISNSFFLPKNQGSNTLGEGHRHQIAGEHLVNGNGNSKRVGHVRKAISQVSPVNNIKQKRNFGELNNVKSAGMAVGENANNQSEEGIQARKKPKLETSQAVVSQVQDVKLRLRQVEIEMAKLRSKQIKTQKGGKMTLSVDSGVVNSSNEDSNLRTILVTNVHYKATKEALSMFFQKCGAVVNVVILNDDMLPVPQRSACVTFESKESADKAMGLSGTTFYSRTIMASRKGDMTNVSSTETVGNRIHGRVPHFKSDKTPEKFGHPGPHFQWRRDPLSSTQSEPPSSS